MKSIVSIVKGEDVDKMVREALDLIGGIKSIVTPGARVLIKPNAHGAHPPEEHITSDPRVVAAVVRLCKEVGAKEVIVGESSTVGQDSLRSLEVSGIKKAAEDAGADRCIDLKKDEYVNIKIPKGKIFKSLDLPKTAVTCDTLIDIPVLKTHHGTRMTCSLKNMKGLLKDADKLRFHKMGLFWAIADLNLARKPDLVVVDCLTAMEGMGPFHGRWSVEAPSGEIVECYVAGGEHVKMDLIIASRDPVAADATCARIIGLDVESVDYIMNAYAHGLGRMKSEEIDVKGKRIKDVARKFKIPAENFADYAEYVTVHDEGACSGCRAYVVWALENLNVRGLLEERKGLTIALGTKKDLPQEWGRGKNLVLFGNCVLKWKGEGVFVSGCPPFGGDVLQAIAESEVEEETPPGEDPWFIKFLKKYPYPIGYKPNQTTKPS